MLGASLPHWGREVARARWSRAGGPSPTVRALAALRPPLALAAAPRDASSCWIDDAVAHPHLADAPAGHVVGVSRHAHATDNTIAVVSAPGIFRPPAAVNEPIKSYAPGSPERAELQARLARDVRPSASTSRW